MTPAAISKAESLRKYALASGSPVNTFALIITLGEAYELLDHLAQGHLGRCQHHDRLVHDIAEAKVNGDPWEILSSFQLQGFDILRADQVLQ